jgi:glycosyltransferase involved in cell wall biosynthesis
MIPARVPTMSSAPIISVVLPVHNGARYLAQAVRSVLRQTFADFELILVDDGSTDATAEIADGFARADERMIVHRESRNRGAAAAANLGMQRARGDLIARMDSDDICRSRRFAAQVEYLRRRPECCIVGTQVLTIDPDGRPIGPMTGLPRRHEKIESDLLSCRWPLVHPSVMMRTSALRDAGGYRADLAAFSDHDLFLRLSERGRLANLGVVGLHYRRHFDSVVHRAGRREHAAIYEIVAQARRRRGLSPADFPAAWPHRPVEHGEAHLEWCRHAWAAGYPGTAWRHAVQWFRESVLGDRSGCRGSAAPPVADAAESGS